jgi:hypothetical protein
MASTCRHGQPTAVAIDVPGEGTIVVNVTALPIEVVAVLDR